MSFRHSRVTNSQSEFESYHIHHIVLQDALLFRVIFDVRNMFKILFCSTPCQTLPPWTLFSWHLYDFGNRMQTDNQLYMRSFLDLPERTQNLAKLKFEVKMLTDTMEHILHDILHVGNFTDSLNLISNMKKLQEIQNMTMNNSRERKWLFESMLKQLKTRDGEDIYPGDVADYVDEVVYEKMNRKLEKRYHKSVINSKMDQTWQRVYLNETQLLEIINDYRSKYQYEIAASMSIKDANEQLIHRLQDEILIISSKHDIDLENLELSCSRKKNELLSLKDKQRRQNERYKELKRYIGNDVLREVKTPTVWTMLEMIIQANADKKLVNSVHKQEKKKPKKVKKKRK